MRSSTRIVATFHALYILIVMYLGPWILLLMDKRYLKYWFMLLVLQYIHWRVFKGECIVSYFEKKMEDKRYKLGEKMNKACVFHILHDWTGISYENHRTLMPLIMCFNVFYGLLLSRYG